MKTALVWRRFGLALALSVSVLGFNSAQADSISGNGIPEVSYDAVGGGLYVNPDGAQLISLIVSGPSATSIDKWANGTSADGVSGWAQAYFNGSEQWVGAGGAVSGEFVTPVSTTYRVATYATGLSLSDFTGVEIGAQDPASPGVGGLILFTDVTAYNPGGLSCDFDGDGDCDSDDITQLTQIGNIAAGVNSGDAGYDAKYDLTGDSTINQDDITRFLADAATENGWAQPYYLGDTDLNGKVEFADFVNLNNNWQSSTLGNGDPVGWKFGDFNGDGTVNFSDFVAQNNNWQAMNSAAGAAAAVPEPAGLAMCGLGLLGLAFRRRRR